MSRVIGVLSGKGGVGKTTIVANLGTSLTYDFRRSIAILDGNITASHLGLHLGLYGDMPVTLKNVIENNAPIASSMFIHPETGVRCLPAPLDGKIRKISKFSRAVNKLKKTYDIVIMDCAPGLGRDVVMGAKMIDQAIIVTTPEIPSATDSLKTVTLLHRLKKEVLGIVLNRVKNKKYELTVGEIESTCGCKVISVIPEDDKVPESISKGMPVTFSYPNSLAAVELKKLAARLVGESYTPPGFLYKLKRIFGH